MLNFLLAVLLVLPLSTNGSDTTEVQELRSNNSTNSFKTRISIGLSPYQHNLDIGYVSNTQFNLDNTYRKNVLKPLVSFGVKTTLNNWSIKYNFLSTFPFQPTLSIHNVNGEEVSTSSIYSIWDNRLSLNYDMPYGFIVGIGYHNFTSHIRDEKDSFDTNFLYELPDQNNLYIKAAYVFHVNEFHIRPSVKWSFAQWRGGESAQFIERRNSNNSNNNGYHKFTSSTSYQCFSLQANHDKLEPFSVSLLYKKYHNSLIDISNVLITFKYSYIFDFK